MSQKATTNKEEEAKITKCCTLKEWQQKNGG